MDHEPIVWEAFEYEPKRRTADWYWAVGIITVAIATVSILLGNILFAVLVVISATTLCIYAHKPPEILNYELSDKGLVIEKRFYPFQGLESFWIEDDTFRDPKLLFKSKKVFMPLIVVGLHDDLDKEVLRDYLRQFLKEVEHSEPLSHKLLEYLGF